MQITKTKTGVIVTGAEYLPDGSEIPDNYTMTTDTSDAPPEMKQEAQNILVAITKGKMHGDLKISGLELDYHQKNSFLDQPGLLERENKPFKIPDAFLLADREQKLNKRAGKTMPKRIHNPVTGKYYEIRQRTTKHGDAGKIKGLWSSKKVSK